MTKGPGGSAGPAGPSGAKENLPGIFLGILLVELVAIAGLYWFGAHFV